MIYIRPSQGRQAEPQRPRTWKRKPTPDEAVVLRQLQRHARTQQRYQIAQSLARIAAAVESIAGSKGAT